MAGNYPDVPGPRMAWERDGSFAAKITDALVVSEITAAQYTALNSEATSSPVRVHDAPGGGNRFGVMFPELRDLSGYFIGWGTGSSPAPERLESSPDTTNLADGTWTIRENPFGVSGANNKHAMRASIRPLALTGIKGLRWRFISGGNAAYDQVDVYQCHIYGKPSVGAAPDRLRLWNPTGDDTEIGGAYFDWGNNQRSSQGEKTFRVHNPGATDALNVTLSVDAPTNANPSKVLDYAFSVDGGTSWVTAPNLGTIAAGATSGDIILRRITPANAAMSLWWPRILVNTT